MKQTTEQERADFEAWARDRYPSIDLTRDRNDYSKALAKDYWSLWQAARRAPAVPVPQGWKLVPVEPTEGMTKAAWELGIREEAPDPYYAYKAMLAAAPQPPDAAPVQLPEPVAIITDTVHREPWWKTMFVPDAGTKLYTEQQVSTILAQHGIKTK